MTGYGFIDIGLGVIIAPTALTNHDAIRVPIVVIPFIPVVTDAEFTDFFIQHGFMAF